MPGWFPEDPVETFKRHMWINPFWEDDVDEVVELMGADRVHLRQRLAAHRGHAPARSTTCTELKAFDDADRKRILRDNVTDLNTPRPT